MPLIYGGAAPLSPRPDDASSIQARMLHSLERQWLDVWRQTAGMQEQVSPSTSDDVRGSSGLVVRREPGDDAGPGSDGPARRDSRALPDMDGALALRGPLPAPSVPLRITEPPVDSHRVTGPSVAGIAAGHPGEANSLTWIQESAAARAWPSVSDTGRKAPQPFEAASSRTSTQSAPNPGPISSVAAGSITRTEPRAAAAQALLAGSNAALAKGAATGASANAPVGHPWREAQVRGVTDVAVATASASTGIDAAQPTSGVMARGSSLHHDTGALANFTANRMSTSMAVPNEAAPGILPATNMPNALRASSKEPAHASESARSAPRSLKAAPALFELTTRRLTLRELDAQQVLAAVRDTQLSAAESQAAAHELARALMRAGYSHIQVVVNGQHERRIGPLGTGRAPSDDTGDLSPAPSTPIEPARHGC